MPLAEGEPESLKGSVSRQSLAALTQGGDPGWRGSVSQKPVVVLMGKGVKAEAVALLSHGFNATAFTEASLLQLAAQGEHLGVHRPWAATEGGPGHPQKFLTTAHNARRHQQGAEQGELPRAEFHRLIPQGHLAEQQMDLKGSDTDPLLQPMAAAAQECAATGRQFLQAEGLSKHIISAGIQQGDHRLRPRTSSQYHDRTMKLTRQSQS
jgi:hypothetical protein